MHSSVSEVLVNLCFRTFYDSKMFTKIAKSQQVNQQHVRARPHSLSAAVHSATLGVGFHGVQNGRHLIHVATAAASRVSLHRNRNY